MLLVGAIFGSVAQAQQTPGDQFLDGIGETALRARYLFAGDANDWSRNNQHAELHGDAFAYSEDERFGKVLSLAGSDSYVELPGDVVDGLDTISVTGWIYVRSAAPWQRFFDFGNGAQAYFFCTPVGLQAEQGLRARLTTSGWADEQGPVAARVRMNHWAHLAVVLNAARQTLTTYVDGKRVGHMTDVHGNLEDVLDPDDAAAKRLFLGKSAFDTDALLNAKLRDVRVYSVALDGRQVAAIFGNAGTNGQIASSSEEHTPQQRPAVAESRDLAGELGLTGVPDIRVETVVGHMPRLPHRVPGVYRSGSDGPLVRVIWPSPEDNRQVAKPGVFTVKGAAPGTAFHPTATITVKADDSSSSPTRHMLAAFPLGDVVLEQNDRQQDTPFIKNRDKFVKTLAQTDPDRFLYMFRDAFGEPQPQGVRPLRGWDSQATRLRGHASGHYLSAVAQAYASATYDAELRADFGQKMDYLIATLHDLASKSGKPKEAGGEFNADPTLVPPGPGKKRFDSDLSREGIRTDYWNWGSGFISAYPPDQFIMLEQGATYGGGNHQVWAPYYTLHKILAGLLDCYEVSGDDRALEIAQGMGLWVHQRLKATSPATRIEMWNRYIAGEYGGMNDVLARLYRLTHDRRFLECAQLFDNTEFFFGDAQHSHGLARYVDTLRGKHANQHIPQIVGALETYRATRDEAYFQVAENFWDICTHGYLYSIGGVAGARNPNNAECFTAEPNTLFANGFARGGQNETCATYNLLKLSRQLFLVDQNAQYMDYYEQALLNHILASVAKNDAGNTYHVPLNPGVRKSFGNARMDGFTCCNGTALESSTKLQDSIYFRSNNDQALFVNLYVPSTLTWKERDVVIRQQTDFPYADTVKIKIAGQGQFALNLRVPRWATSGFVVRINGVEHPHHAAPGSYLRLERQWEDDLVEIQALMSFHLHRVMDRPNIASLFYGPVLLAAEEESARSDWRPLTLEASDLGSRIQGDPSSLRFRVLDAKLKPFFETYSRHSVYLDVTLE